MFRMVNLTKIGDKLKVELTPEGREELIDWELDRHSGEDLLLQLLEFHLCNGWDSINPEHIGALTDSLIISDEIEYDDRGEEVVEGGRVYWHPNYMVEDPIQTLLEKGVFWMTGAKIEAGG